MIPSMVIGDTSIHKYVMRPNVPKLRDASVYMHFQYYDNNVVVLPLLIFILCHMALSPLSISCRQQSKQLGSHGHMLLGRDLDSNKSLSILESFKVVNLLKMMYSFIKNVLF